MLLMNMDNKQVIVVALIAILFGGVGGVVFAQHQSIVEINELKGELEETTDACRHYGERVAELEDAINVIVMERTTYIELSFAEIQRLRAELNATKQLLEEMNQTSGCLVVDELGPLRGTMTITTSYGDGSVETRIVDVYQKGGGVVITRTCK